MNRKIGILRGINFGGKRKILMADLKSICKKMKLTNVKSYIQSGNLIFDSNKTNAELEDMLEKAIKEDYGFDVPVIVRSKNELKNSINNNPFIKKDIDSKHLHMTFLKDVPAKENLANILTNSYEPDKFIIDNKNVYIYCADKYHKSKLTNNFFEKKLKVGATTRNWKTVLKLMQLSEDEF